MISINMEKARNIKRDKLRLERAPLMAKLDIDFMKALESGDSTKQSIVIAKKQALRDITDHLALEQATSISELKAITLESLLEKD